jgi:hypothetical protein
MSQAQLQYPSAFVEGHSLSKKIESEGHCILAIIRYEQIQISRLLFAGFGFLE